jgi:hypothetical protein
MVKSLTCKLESNKFVIWELTWMPRRELRFREERSVAARSFGSCGGGEGVEGLQHRCADP